MGTTTLESPVRIYQCCELHAHHFNKVFAPLNAHLHTIAILVVICSVYASFRLERLFAAIAAYWMFVALYSYLSAANSFAEINRQSALLLQVMRSSDAKHNRSSLKIDRKIDERRLKSLRELRISAGSVFYYDKALVLTIVEIILVQSVNLLVMY